MLPPSPLTDPDVQISRIRFLTEEVRSPSCPLSAAVTCTGLRGAVSPPVCPVNSSLLWRLPSLQRVPSIRFPAFTDTTETLRHPALHTGRLWFRFRLPRFPPLFRVSLARSRQTGGGLSRPGALLGRRPPFPRGQFRTSQVPWPSIPCLCRAPRPRPNPGILAHSGCLNAAPAPSAAKAPAVTSFRGQTHTA